MQKRLSVAGKQDQGPAGNWLDLERLAEVELTSEDAAHPIESALVAGPKVGWRAAEPGEQRISLLFHEPQRLQRILLRFVEAAAERTQEFTLRWSADGGRSFRELIRQQYTFSPRGATTEIEDFRVDLPGVTALELTIIPAQRRGEAYASLAEWRLA
jgi:hypothetical protein